MSQQLSKSGSVRYVSSLLPAVYLFEAWNLRQVNVQGDADVNEFLHLSGVRHFRRQSFLGLFLECHHLVHQLLQNKASVSWSAATGTFTRLLFYLAINILQKRQFWATTSSVAQTRVFSISVEFIFT